MAAEVTATFDSSTTTGASPLQVVILDVGHGNCTIIRDGNSSCVVDIPRDRGIIDAIIENDCAFIKHLVLSHPDEDHIGGAARLLADPDVSIENFWCNSSAIQDTATYRDLLEQAALREDAGQTRYRNNLNVAVRDDLNFGRAQLEVIHPDVVRAGVGQTKKEHKFAKITSNGMSVVIRVSLDGIPAALLAADIDSAGLRSIVNRGSDLSSPILVFPHHGGATGGRDEQDFAETICRATSPNTVVFSLGRARFNNPLPEILEGVRTAAPSAHIACTQLSRRCHGESNPIPTTDNSGSSWPSRGNGKGHCCAGTIVLTRSANGIEVSPSAAVHGAFVQRVSSAQCLIDLNSSTPSGG